MGCSKPNPINGMHERSIKEEKSEKQEHATGIGGYIEFFSHHIFFGDNWH